MLLIENPDMFLEDVANLSGDDHPAVRGMAVAMANEVVAAAEAHQDRDADTVLERAIDLAAEEWLGDCDERLVDDWHSANEGEVKAEADDLMLAKDLDEDDAWREALKLLLTEKAEDYVHDCLPDYLG